MRGIRIWHLAALALSLPFLAAATQTNCGAGLFNPNFIGLTGGNAAAANVAAPDGFVVLAFFNYFGYPGTVDFTVRGNGGGQSTAWKNWPLYPDKPSTFTWACKQWIYELDLNGGNLNVVDPTTGAITKMAISYSGGPLGNNQVGDPLECGSLIKANVVQDPAQTTLSPIIIVELVK